MDGQDLDSGLGSGAARRDMHHRFRQIGPRQTCMMGTLGGNGTGTGNGNGDGDGAMGQCGVNGTFCN